MTITIYHNPDCGTSRNTLAMIRQSGEEPEIIEYLKTPPSRDRLVELIRDMGITPRALLRRKGTPYDELGLDDLKWSDGEIIDFMLAHPILINRPIVVTPKGTRLCRPSEAVLDILPNPDIGPFTKNDGEVVIDARPAHHGAGRERGVSREHDGRQHPRFVGHARSSHPAAPRVIRGVQFPLGTGAQPDTRQCSA